MANHTTPPNPPSEGRVRCRFAPSPTGYLHVGGARTALFNYLFARNRGGTFILRIEDTDIQRSTEEATRAIFEGLHWLRLTPDEGPFFQTQRLEIYREYARRLLAAGHAYRCSCTPEELESVRRAQREAHEKPQYNRKHRPVALTPQEPILPTAHSPEPFVIRLRAPLDGETAFHDAILGPIITANSELDDFILIRSDGTPTYNFVVVVDDIEMRITHVIRGMDHVSNTPKQILIYRALGAPLPEFAHVPMILGPDKKKLSKRHGATSVIEYKREGYLSDAFVNYLARLGWSHGDQEIFSREELEKCFSLEQIGKSAAVFDFEKLLWVNSEHLKLAPIESIVAELADFLPVEHRDTEQLLEDRAFRKLVDSLRARAKTLKEFAEQCQWYFAADESFQIGESAASTHLTPAARPGILAVLEGIQTIPSFDEPSLEALIREVTKRLGVKMVQVAQPIRVALTGRTVSPPVNTVMDVLGQERTLSRLRRALSLCGGSTNDLSL